MIIPDSFEGRLRIALKQANVSPSALGSAVGVDKSVVSRWLSGRVRPTQHNLTRIAAVLSERLPGFTVLTFESSADEFRTRITPRPPMGSSVDAAQTLAVPLSALEAARRETNRRGTEYFGAYLMYYRSFSMPGKVARMALLFRPEDGLIEARYGADGYSFRGWALMMLNRMYVIFAEEDFEAMAFLVLNPGQQPKARFVTGVLAGNAEGLLVPTASPAVLVRLRDLTGDRDADIAAHQEEAKLAPRIEIDEVPEAVRRALDRSLGLLQVPYANGTED